MGKGEIAHYKQFLIFPQCFQRLVHQTRKNQGLFGKGLKVTQMFGYDFNNVEKIGKNGEKTGYHHFLPFPQCSPHDHQKAEIVTC